MANQIYKGKKMYAIFSGIKNGIYVQPCVISEILPNGFIAECHNGGESGNDKGTEFFSTSDIGVGIFYSQNSAQVVINRRKQKVSV